jgi:nucleoside-diphosphate-sugar epimerase
MRILSLLTLLSCTMAFVPRAVDRSTLHTSLQLAAEDSSISRRDVFQTAVAGAAAAATVLTSLSSSPALAEEGAVIKNVVVSGATGQTGSRIYERLVAQDFVATGGVRNVAKASKSLSGNIQHLDVVEDSLEILTQTLKGADGLIIASGMNPGKNLLRMSAAAHEVDNVGTCKLIEAAKQAGVKKVVLVSSILTDGRSWGQEQSPGFVATNAFGGALDEKLVAEKYLIASGIDYTIIRPGGLKGKGPTGALSINPENTLNSGEISRDLVADVSVASLNNAKASKTVLEIIEDEGTPPKAFNGLFM